MVILITGATGFLGSYLLDDLSEFDLRVLTRSPHKLNNRALDVVKTDITKPLDKSIFDDVEILIHSAAKIGSWPKDPKQGYYQTNVEATRNIISMAIEQNIDKIIYTSSYFALGPTEDGVKDESWDNPPDFEHPYITTKYEAGKVVDELAKDYPITQLLPTFIVGQGIDNPLSDNLIDYINGRFIGLPGGGNSIVNFVGADDVARAHLHSIQRNTEGKYLITGENLSFFEFFNKFGKRLGIKPPRSIPFVLATFYAFLQELRKTPQITRGEVKILSKNFQYKSSRKSDLGIENKAIDNIVDEMLIDFLHKGKLNKKGEKRALNYLNSK